VADRRERPGVDDLAREARDQPLREPARQREAVDHDGRVAREHVEEVAREPRGVDRHRVVRLLRLRLERLVEARARRRDLGEPRAATPAGAVEAERLRARRQLREHELRVADDRHVGGHVPADARRRRVDLDVRRVGVPGGRLAEVLAAPEAEADREDHVGAARERLLPRAADGERIVLGHRALAGAPRVDRDRHPACERLQLGGGVGPEDAVAGDDERARCARERSSARSIDAGSPALRSASGG
jgi:hypothetical protein